MWSMFSVLDWAKWSRPNRLDKETLQRAWLWKEKLYPSMFLQWNSEYSKTLCVFSSTWPSVDEFAPLREHSNVQWKAHSYSEKANILRLPCVSVTWIQTSWMNKTQIWGARLILPILPGVRWMEWAWLIHFPKGLFFSFAWFFKSSWVELYEREESIFHRGEVATNGDGLAFLWCSRSGRSTEVVLILMLWGRWVGNSR